MADRENIHAAIAQERRAIADLIDGLSEDELTTPSLCAGWDAKTVAAHLLVALTDGPAKAMRLAIRRRSMDRAFDELARRKARLPTCEITAGLRELADHRYWRLPPRAPGLLAETLCHSGDIRVPLALPFQPDPPLTATTLDFLTGPVPDRTRGTGTAARDSLAGHRSRHRMGPRFGNPWPSRRSPAGNGRSCRSSARAGGTWIAASAAALRHAGLIHTGCRSLVVARPNTIESPVDTKRWPSASRR